VLQIAPNTDRMHMQWQLQPDAVEDKGSSDCHREDKSPNNGLICSLVPVTLYSTLGFEENIFWTTVAGTNKNNACNGYMHRFAHIYLTIQQ